MLLGSDSITLATPLVLTDFQILTLEENIDLGVISDEKKQMLNQLAAHSLIRVGADESLRFPACEVIKLAVS